MNSSLVRWVVTRISIAMTLVAGPLLAADVQSDTQGPGPSASQLDEIIVTAQKREQNINDVGITIATESRQQLQDNGITNVLQLDQVVPGLQIGHALGGVYPVFSIRGVSFNAGQLSAAPAVSMYLDEASLPYSAMAGNLLLDVDRVEVLKGPQGTLFGQNATGGSINVIAAKPTSTFSTGADGEINNFGQTTINAYVSGPISDTLLARLAVTTTQFGAWQKGYYLNDRENGDQNRAGARLLLDWKPTEQFTVGLNVNGFYDHGEAQQPQLGAVVPSAPSATYPGLVGYPVASNDRDAEIPEDFNTHARNSFYQAALRLDFAVNDNMKLTSLTDYTHYVLYQHMNEDGTALPILKYLNQGTISSINQELRVSGTIPSANVNYIVGANYQRDEVPEDNITYGLNYSGLPPGTQLDADYRQTNRAAAVFANVDFEIAPRLTITTGARYTSTKQTQTGCTYGESGSSVFGYIANLFRGAAGLPPTDAYVDGGCITINDLAPNPQYLPIYVDQSQTENNVSWRGGLNYKMSSDSLLYGLVSRGYKSGVFPVQNTIFVSAGGPVQQEELTSYELGTKADFLGRTVHLNASVFFYDYKDKQFYTIVPVPIVGTTSSLVNIPKSTVKGVDLDATAKPTDSLTLRGGVTYVDTSIGNYQGYNFNGDPADFSGKEFNYAPPVSATFDAEYKRPMGHNLNWYLGVGGVYNSHTYSTLDEEPQAELPQYALINARFGVESQDWRVALFVRNLTDKYYWSSVNEAGDTRYRESGLPRTFGVMGSIKFH